MLTSPTSRWEASGTSLNLFVPHLTGLYNKDNNAKYNRNNEKLPVHWKYPKGGSCYWDEILEGFFLLSFSYDLLFLLGNCGNWPAKASSCQVQGHWSAWALLTVYIDYEALSWFTHFCSWTKIFTGQIQLNLNNQIKSSPEAALRLNEGQVALLWVAKSC